MQHIMIVTDFSTCCRYMFPQHYSTCNMFICVRRDLHLAIVHKFIETVYALVRLVPHPKYLNIRNNDRQVRYLVVTLGSRCVINS